MKLKLTVALALVALVIVVVCQNLQSVTTRLLFVKVEMPVAALLVITMLIGIAVGILTALTLSLRKSGKD